VKGSEGFEGFLFFRQCLSLISRKGTRLIFLDRECVFQISGNANELNNIGGCAGKSSLFLLTVRTVLTNYNTKHLGIGLSSEEV